MISEPAVGKAFFGREDVLKVLEKRMNALQGGYRQNVALTGQMLAGKSSIIRQFLATMRSASLVPVYIEVVPESFPFFASKFIATLLHNYLALCGREPAKNVPELMKAAESVIPHTILAAKRVQHAVSRKKYNDAYRKLLNLTSILKKETGKSCIVIFDEFHNLEFTRIKNPYFHFGRIIMIQKDTMYIVSSSQKNTIKKILSEKLALLYGNFEIIEISGFDFATARSFLKQKLGSAALDARYADYLIDFTDGNPFYLGVMARKLASIAARKGGVAVGPDEIEEAFTELMHNTSGTINQYFTNTIMSLMEKDLRRDYVDLMIALSHGRDRLKDIASWFGRRNVSGFSAKLGRLMELDIVSKNGIFYDLQDRVMKFWLRTVYHRRISALVDDIAGRESAFREELRADLTEYLDACRGDTMERTRDLLMAFDGEIAEIAGKKRHLPRFAKTEILRYGGMEDMVGYDCRDRYWVFQVNKKRLDEASVANFIERYYPMKDRISRKICVALDGVDENALLLAKEKCVWVWELADINELMKIYKKHRIVAS